MMMAQELSGENEIDWGESKMVIVVFGPWPGPPNDKLPFCPWKEALLKTRSCVTWVRVSSLVCAAEKTGTFEMSPS